MLAPVIVFVYNRPEHTEKTIEALARNFKAQETEVFIFSDAAKDEKSIETVRKTRKYIDGLVTRELFKKVEIIKANENKGLAKSVIDGVTEVISKFGKVIVVEDDLVSSRDFLIFMNEGLEYYRDNSSIWSISGYNIPIPLPKEYTKDIYLSYRGCSWGWATWIDRWNTVDWNVMDYKEFKKEKTLRQMLNRGGRDLSIMMDLQMNHKIDSWAIRWCYSQSKQNKYTVYPTTTRIMNIGLDGSGTHSGNTTEYDVEFSNVNEPAKFENVVENKRIIKKFKQYYMSKTELYIYELKQFIKKKIRL